MLHAAIVLLAYLLGSIPFGYLLVRLFVGGDVRETGSGGTGATNVTRRAGRRLGMLTLLLDLLKGAAAVLIAKALLGAGDDAHTEHRKLMLPGDRHLIRWRASQAALDLLRRRLI